AKASFSATSTRSAARRGRPGADHRWACRLPSQMGISSSTTPIVHTVCPLRLRLVGLPLADYSDDLRDCGQPRQVRHASVSPDNLVTTFDWKWILSPRRESRRFEYVDLAHAFY